MSTDTTTRTLPLLPLPQGVVLPEMVITVALESDEAKAVADAATDGDLVLVPRIDDHRFARIGTLAHIENRGALPNGTPALMVRATGRAVLGGGALGSGGGLWVTAEPAVETTATERSAALAERVPRGGRCPARPTGRPTAGIGAARHRPPGGAGRHHRLLARPHLRATTPAARDARRGRPTGAWPSAGPSTRSARSRSPASIRDEVSQGIEREQRETLLRRQLAAIQAELGDGGRRRRRPSTRSRLAELMLPEARDGGHRGRDRPARATSASRAWRRAGSAPGSTRCSRSRGASA